MEEQKTVYDIIVEKIMKLDIEPAIKSNPAFPKIIADIARLVPEKAVKDVRFDVRDEGKIIISDNDNNYTCSIQSTDSTSFTVNVTNEQPIHKEDGRVGIGKACTEKRVELKGGTDLRLVTYSGSAKDSVNGIVYPESHYEEKWYTQNGVVRDIEERTYKESSSNSYDGRTVENLDVTNILYTPKQSTSSYDKKRFISREGFDVASVLETDAQGNKLYKGHVQINNEYGVSDMNIGNRYQEVDPKIEPFSPELVEIIIKKEKDPRTQEELRNRAKTQNRENYSYDATLDPNYVNTSNVK